MTFFTLLLQSLIIVSTFLFSKSQIFDGIPGCRTTKLELVFLVDGSSSITYQDFSLVKQWVSNMTSNFDISPSTTRVAVVQYSSHPRTEFDLNTYNDINGVLRGINRIVYMAGRTQTGHALLYAIERIFDDARPGSAKVVIVLSDGQSQDKVERASIELHASGIATFAVGVGNTRSSTRIAELRKITSGPAEYNDNVFMVEDYHSIGQIQRQLIGAVCDQTVQECPTATHDLAFVIDASSTIGYDDFLKVKEWMKKIVNAFDIGPNDTRVAVIQYSTIVREEFNFHSLLSKEEVINAIDRMEYMMGDTHTGDALMYMLNTIYTERNGDRPDVPDMAIVMTDGKAQEPDQVISASKAVHEAGISVYAVGVGDYSLDEVKAIASDPDRNYVIEALNFDIIELKRLGLVKSICTELEPTCPTATAEIVFLVDGSTSVGPDNFEKIKQWIKRIVDAFQVGTYYARVAVVQFTAFPHLEFDLTDHDTTQSTLQAIQRIRYRGGSTNIGRAMEFTMDRVFSETRQDVPKILVVLTDGRSQDDVRAAVEGAKEVGVHTLVFGIGNTQPSQLREIVAETDNVFKASGFDEILRMQRKLVSLICIEVEPECSSQELDLHFLVDSSNSIGEKNFEKIKVWIKNMVRSFDVGMYTTRIALTQYSDGVKPEFALHDYRARKQIDHAVDQLKLNGGPTMMAEALNYVRRNGFSRESGGRTGAPKVLIVISDGRSGENRENLEDAARRLRDSGVNIFSVGAGNVYQSGMELIGSNLEYSHVQELNSYDVINRYRRELVGEICRETKSECPNVEMDLIFLIDGSNSIGRGNFETMKEWIISFVQQFEIGEYNTKIGIIQYSSNLQSELDIGAYESKDELISAINRIEFASGTTNTDSALDYIRNIGFSTKRGARRGVPKVLVILTNGDAEHQLTLAAQELRRQGVEVYAIGVGRANVRELNAVMDEPVTSNVYNVRNYGAIKTIQSGLVRKVCAKVEPDCGKTATDLMFLVDGSTSVGEEDWAVVKTFMQNVTDKFKISQDYVRVGVIQYASYPRNDVVMGEYNGKEDLVNALSRMNWKSGNTYTARALRYVLRSYKQAPLRPNVRQNKLLIVITDGSPQDRLEVIPAVNKLHQAGWRIFAIGIGQARLSELEVLASNPNSDHVFHADDYISTKKFLGRLTRLICGDSRYEFEQRASASRLADLDSTTPKSKYRSRQSTSRRRAFDGHYSPSSMYRKSYNRHSNQLHYRRNLPYYVNTDSNGASPNRLVFTTTPSVPNTSTVTKSFNNSLCPTLWRNGKRVSGIDFLNALGMRNRQSSSRKKNIKVKKGSQATAVAYRVQQGRIPAKSFEELIASGLPSSFSLVAVFRMHGRTIKDTWTLLSVISSSGTTKFAISFNGGDRSMYISWSSYPSVSSVETKSLGGPLVAGLFDRSFHKLELLVDDTGVTAMIDCQQVKARLNFESPIFQYSGSIVSFVVSQRPATVVDLQDITLKCGENIAEECCELPGNKCSPLAENLSECGCLPNMKTAKVREAEIAEITRIATAIANKIVEEKISNLLKHLDLDTNLFAATPGEMELNMRLIQKTSNLSPRR